MIHSTSGWSYDGWQGKFYPADLAKSHWFEFYASQFNTVEINATFYRFFKAETFKRWYAQAPKEFRYVVKVPQLITHRKYLKNVTATIKDFTRVANHLQEKLALYLLQLHPSMPYDLARLEKALQAFDDPRKVVVEVRNNHWRTPACHALLQELGAIYANVDSPECKLEHQLTSKIGYIRLHGTKVWFADNYTHHGLAKIVECARSLHEQGATQVFIFFNNDVNAYAAQNALKLKSLLAC